MADEAAVTYRVTHNDHGQLTDWWVAEPDDTDGTAVVATPSRFFIDYLAEPGPRVETVAWVFPPERRWVERESPTPDDGGGEPAESAQYETYTLMVLWIPAASSMVGTIRGGDDEPMAMGPETAATIEEAARWAITWYNDFINQLAIYPPEPLPEEG